MTWQVLSVRPYRMVPTSNLGVNPNDTSTGLLTPRPCTICTRRRAAASK